MLSELLRNGKDTGCSSEVLSVWCFFFLNFADSNTWKLKLGHLSLELRLGFPMERVTEFWVKSLGGGGLPFPSHA